MRVNLPLRIAVAGTLALLTATPQALQPQPVQAGVTRPHCEVCGRYTDTSPSRIRATLRIKRHDFSIDVCSWLCYAERLEEGEYEVRSVQVPDYDTLEDEYPVILNATHASYLYGTSGDADKTSEPFVLAFASKRAAEKARETLEGELLDWDSLEARITALAEDYEPPQPKSQYQPLRRRNPK